jgi:hypothetical protein
MPVDADRRPVGTRVQAMTDTDDFPAQDRALVARMMGFLGHIEDMGDEERLFMLGALTGALERRLNPPPAALMRPGRKLSRTAGLCTVYAVTGDDWEAHACVGIMATPAIAEAVCEAVNARGVPLPAEGNDQ